MSVEAMKLALEALEEVQGLMNTSDWFNERVDALRVAIASYSTAISEVERYEDEKFKPDWMNYQEGFAAGVLEGREQMKQSAEERSSVERVEPVEHDYRIRYDRGCYKCTSHYCPGNCVAVTPPYVATPLAAQEEIQRLSALVRAQQITIDKLETQRPVAKPHKWIGLTADEMEGLYQLATYMDETDHIHMLMWAEEKLKEKNHHE